MTEKQRITDDSDLKRYRTEIPNMADDEMDPFQYRLYAHYKRVGTCTESVRTTAKKTRMSIGKVVETRDWLEQNGWITVKEQADSPTLKIRVVDRWLENMTRYDKSVHDVNNRSSGEQKRSPHEHQRSPGEPKKEPIKKEPIKKDSSDQKSQRPRNPHFDAICAVCGLDPSRLPPETKGSAIGTVIKSIKHIWGADDIMRYHAWRQSKGLPPLGSIHWLVTEMAKREWCNGTRGVRNPDVNQQDMRARESVRKIMAEKKAMGER